MLENLSISRKSLTALIMLLASVVAIVWGFAERNPEFYIPGFTLLAVTGIGILATDTWENNTAPKFTEEDEAKMLAVVGSALEEIGLNADAIDAIKHLLEKAYQTKEEWEAEHPQTSEVTN